MKTAHESSSFTLDDESKELAEAFYSAGPEQSGDGYVTSQPGFVLHVEGPVPERDPEAVPSGIFSRVASSFLKYTDLSRYATLFSVTIDDVVGRVFRGCVPYKGLLEPPAPPPTPPSPHASEPRSEPDVETDRETELSDTEDVLTAGHPEQSQVRQVTSVESQKPFNEKEDLYGPFWLSTTLVLTIAVASNMSTLLRSIYSREDALRGQMSTLSAIDFRNLVHAASFVYSYIIISSVAVAALKRYISDPAISTVTRVICVYGYATSPLIPAVLVCALGDNALSWSALILAGLVSAWTVVRNLWPGTTLSPFAQGQDLDSSVDSGITYGAPAPSASVAGASQTRLKCGAALAHVIVVMTLKLRFF